MTNEYQNVYVPYLKIDTGIGYAQKIEGNINWAFDLEQCEAWLEKNRKHYAATSTVVAMGYELKQVVPQTLNSKFPVFKTLSSHTEYDSLKAA